MHGKSLYHKEIQVELAAAMHLAVIATTAFREETLPLQAFTHLWNDVTSFNPSLDSLVKIIIRRRRGNMAVHSRDSFSACAIKLWNEGETWSSCPPLAGS